MAGFGLPSRRVMETIFTASFESEIGRLKVASTSRGLAYVALPRADGRGLMGWRQRHLPEAPVVDGFEPNRKAIVQITEYLAGKREHFELELDVLGTDFQREVYDAVASIPMGEWRSYAEVAETIGRPRAVRAVGAANRDNPLPLVIPCHRVLSSDGHLHGYAGGLELKARLLRMEKASPPGQLALC